MTTNRNCTAFFRLWQDDDVSERLFELLAAADICSVRLANSACCNLVTKRLFLRTQVTFAANTFTKPSRIQALSRIGHHIEHLTFHFAHSDATFLPPLIHPQTGREICFLYTPHTSMASVMARPKYANSELGEVLTQQYPPLFHAATNVPSFINAMQKLPNMRHLTIKTPHQDPKERYRRDIVDYALISLRISIERTQLLKLTKLSLSGVHAGAFICLRHIPTFGASPGAMRRWRQIRKLYISVESWDFYGPSPGLDLLKIIDDFISNFGPNLEKFSFTWLGCKGPCPLALSGDPLFAPPPNTRKLFNEVTSPMSPLPPRPSRTPLHLPRLRYMQIRNATMTAPQVSSLVGSHKSTVREFDFENVVLIKGGTWEDALSPLTDANAGGRDAWSRHSVSESYPPASPHGSNRISAAAEPHEDDTLPSPSAAVTVASRELFEVDVGGLLFGEVNAAHGLAAGVEQWARGISADVFEREAPAHATRTVQEKVMTEDDGGLASDVEAAKEASLTISTRIKKRRIRKKSSRQDGEKPVVDEKDGRRTHHSRTCKKEKRSCSRHRDKHHHSHRRHGADEAVAMPTSEVNGSTDDLTVREGSQISGPILNYNALPVLLQPTIFDPLSNSTRHAGHSDVLDDGLSSAQRSIEAGLRDEAEEAATRSSALKRAKQTVLLKLSHDFFRRKLNAPLSKEWPTVNPDVSKLNLGLNMPYAPLKCGSSVGFRLRDGLFGRSAAAMATRPDHGSLDSRSTLVPLVFGG